MKRFAKILVVAGDDRSQTQSALDMAVELAGAGGAAITVLSVVEGSSDVRDRSSLDAVGGPVSQTGVTIDRDVVIGVPHLEVLRRVVARGHDLVVIARQPQSRWFGSGGGSTLVHLLRRCPVPLWVQSPVDPSARAMVVAVGPLGMGRHVEVPNVRLLQLGGWLATMRESALHVVHVWHIDGDSRVSSRRLAYPLAAIETVAADVVTEARAELDWLIDRARLARSGIRLHIRNGYPADVLVQEITDIGARVLVMGTMVRTGIQGLMAGNTAQHVIPAVNCSVLAVKPQESAVGPRPELAREPATSRR